MYVCMNVCMYVCMYVEKGLRTLQRHDLMLLKCTISMLFEIEYFARTKTSSLESFHVKSKYSNYVYYFRIYVYLSFVQVFSTILILVFHAPLSFVILRTAS